MECNFKYSHLREIYETALNKDYQIITCREYVDYKKNCHSHKIFVNRVDIDITPRKAKILAHLFNELNINGTFFIRLHADEYNPFSFENYRCIKYIIETGHEIGLHCEIIDGSNIWTENAEECLRRDLSILNRMFSITVKGASSHGGLTGFNNLDFWENRKPSDFGLLYEAYDNQPEFNLFYDSFYVSDSNYTFWKCYNKGKLNDGDNRCLCKHINDGHQIINSLIHPISFYNEHFHE